MKKNTNVIALAIFLFTFISVNIFAQDTEIPQSSNEGAKLTIVSGVKGGSYFTMAQDMQKMTRKAYGEIKYIESTDTAGNTIKTPTKDTADFLLNKESDGSYYNFQKINKQDVDITFLQYDVLLYEDMLDLNRKFKKTTDIRILLPMGVEQIHIITLKNNKINEFKDLNGKKVGIGTPLQGTNVTAKFIKAKLGAKWEDVEMPYDKAFKALFSGTIDAFFFVGAVPVTNLGDLTKSMKDQIKLVSIPDNPVLKEAYGEQVEITNNDYKWLSAPVKTYGVKSVLVTSITNMTPEKEDALIKLLQEIKKSKDTQGYHPNWKKVEFKKDEAIEWKYFDAAVKLYN